ncbi:hypothetical protein EON81_03040 [bacterium]|nr:MAG: hypothetical protein EON81_03040 [bacterium]
MRRDYDDAKRDALLALLEWRKVPAESEDFTAYEEFVRKAEAYFGIVSDTISPTQKLYKLETSLEDLADGFMKHIETARHDYPIVDQQRIIAELSCEVQSLSFRVDQEYSERDLRLAVHALRSVPFFEVDDDECKIRVERHTDVEPWRWSTTVNGESVGDDYSDPQKAMNAGYGFIWKKENPL